MREEGRREEGEWEGAEGPGRPSDGIQGSALSRERPHVFYHRQGRAAAFLIQARTGDSEAVGG